MVVVGLEGGFGEGGSGGWLEPASKSLPTCFLVGGGPWQHPSRICKAGLESSAELAFRLSTVDLLTWGVDGCRERCGRCRDRDLGGGAGSQSMPRLDDAEKCKPLQLRNFFQSLSLASRKLSWHATLGGVWRIRNDVKHQRCPRSLVSNHIRHATLAVQGSGVKCLSILRSLTGQAASPHIV